MLRFAGLAFPAWVYAFTAPRSYTGEDSIEFHIPGSVVLAKMLLDHLYQRGARPAEPGEFTARAFFNGRIGLTQAEGVAATISAGNEAELDAARQLLAGELARRLAPILDSLAQTLALVEVGIDFTDEQVTFLSAEEVSQHLTEADESLGDLLDQSAVFEQLSHEPRLVFAGRPNAGKSSLINALTGRTRAIVSDLAGTTRDVLTAPLDLPRGRVLLADVAGIDSAESAIDHGMQQQAATAIASADHVILLCDCTDDRPPLVLERTPSLVVRTKIDLRPKAESADLCISVTTGEGLDTLKEHLDALAFGVDRSGATLALNRRHIAAIQAARESIARAQANAIENTPELLAMDLRDALDLLGGVVGQVTTDDLLGRIFSAFCIGK
jgi:tRNA modification GTPase